MAPPPSATGRHERQQQQHKRARQVRPEMLPEGPWRRKADREKQDLIHAERVKRTYARLRARELGAAAAAAVPPVSSPAPSPPDENAAAAAAAAPATSEMHPDRQAMLDSRAPAGSVRGREPLPRKKSANLARAERARAEKEARAEAIRERGRQRAEALERRARRKKTLARARADGGGGVRKLGKESGLLLDRVKRMMGGGVVGL